MDNEKQELIGAKEQRITDLICELSSPYSDCGDWKVTKIYEARMQGQDDPYDFKALMEARQAKRDEINILQVEIAELKAGE